MNGFAAAHALLLSSCAVRTLVPPSDVWPDLASGLLRLLTSLSLLGFMGLYHLEAQWCQKADSEVCIRPFPSALANAPQGYPALERQLAM